MNFANNQEEQFTSPSSSQQKQRIIIKRKRELPMPMDEEDAAAATAEVSPTNLFIVVDGDPIQQQQIAMKHSPVEEEVEVKLFGGGNTAALDEELIIEFERIKTAIWHQGYKYVQNRKDSNSWRCAVDRKCPATAIVTEQQDGRMIGKTNGKQHTHLPISPEEKAQELAKRRQSHKEPPMKICILTVSDSSYEKPELDKSGPLLAELLQNSMKLAGTMEIVDCNILPDEREEIIEYLIINARRADCILTTGGTGMGQRDVTPEATKEVIERECPGIVTAILMRGLQATPFAALTRLAAGIRANCLIVNLPGSPKAVREGFEVLEPILSHAVALLRDRREDIGRDHRAINGPQDGYPMNANARALFSNMFAH